MNNKPTDTLCLIPARGGSKGIPKKNIKKCFGKPLIDFTITKALELFDSNKIIVSSDDEKILDRAKYHGVLAFKRPRFISQDDTPMISVIRHVLACTDYSNDYLVLLQPTSPFRDVKEIKLALKKLIDCKLDTVASVSEVPREYSPELMVEIIDERMQPAILGEVPTRRQDTKAFYQRNGQFYIIRTKPIIYGDGLYDGKVFAFKTSSKGFNLDTKEDWEKFIESRPEKLSH